MKASYHVPMEHAKINLEMSIEEARHLHLLLGKCCQTECPFDTMPVYSSLDDVLKKVLGHPLPKLGYDVRARVVNKDYKPTVFTYHDSSMFYLEFKKEG